MRGTPLTRLGFLLLAVPFVYLIGMSIVDRSAWWTADPSAQQWRAALLYGCLVFAAVLGVTEYFRQRGREDGRRRAGAVILLFACMVAFFPVTAVIYAPVIRDLPARAETEAELQKIYAALEIYAAQSPHNLLPDGNREEARLEGDGWSNVAGEELAGDAQDYVYFINRVVDEQRALEYLDPARTPLSATPSIDSVVDQKSGESHFPNRVTLPDVGPDTDEMLAGSAHPLLFERYDFARGGGYVLFTDGRVEFVRRPMFPYTDALIQAVEKLRAGN